MNFRHWRIEYAKEMIGPIYDDPNVNGSMWTSKGIFDYKEVRAKGNWDEFMVAAMDNNHTIWYEIIGVTIIILSLYEYSGIINLWSLLWQ